ncbi:MAG: tetratricopeptide (TPR) repeat protein [Cellvibrionaceae bacterium]|jgi:tetratricopeptide (TPR) repeat protein
MKVKNIVVIFLFAILLASAFARAEPAQSIDDSIVYLQSEWAKIKYQVIGKEIKIKEIRALEENGEKLIDAFPDRAEPKIWQAIILSTDAGITNNLSSLGKLRKARKLLVASIKADPTALQGSAYTSLASLYYQAPKWPLSFGNFKKAEDYFSKSLEINPTGIDPNFFYGDFLMKKEEYSAAQKYFQRALAAEPRKGRKLADEGRKQEIRAKLASLTEDNKN